jgi:hypothetical protein
LELHRGHLAGALSRLDCHPYLHFEQAMLPYHLLGSRFPMPVAHATTIAIRTRIGPITTKGLPPLDEARRIIKEKAGGYGA